MTTTTTSSGMGIMLLHPFLTPLFKQLGLLTKGQFVNGVARLKALAVLRYIAFGNESVAEQSLAFFKFLCGIGATQSIQEVADLPGEAIEMIRECLQAFIAYWPALKNTSVETLRTSFLQRQGSFSKEGDHIVIYVAGSGIDILLDQYPWNLSIIKLPWIKPLLYLSIG